MSDVASPRRPGRQVLAALAIAAAGALIVAIAGWWVLATTGLPRRSGDAVLNGLDAPVSVHFDGWGVPHVQADSVSDMARAVGYLHANDRMTQLELGRRMAAGRLAEVVGDLALPSDRYFVQLGMRRYARASVAALGPESRLLLEAYAEGVNAWLAERGGDLPPELRLLRVVPAPWTVLDSAYFQLQMAHDLSFFQGRPEEDRFIALRDLGVARFSDLTDLAERDLPPQIVELAAAPPLATRISESTRDGQLAAAPLFPPLQSPGSNNWALGGSFTASGHPIVANDPHLPLRLPSIWYQASLHAPGYSAAGMTLPGFPFVVLGQGPDLAWAFTNVMLDDHDVFFERASDDLRRVQRAGGWLDVTVDAEEIIHGDGSSEIATVRFTDIGVLLPADAEQGLPARSLAWTGATPGDLPAPALALARARRVEDLVGQLEQWVAPAQNLVAADRTGSLLFTAIGRVPQRRNATGRLPSPAWDSAAHWLGLYPQHSNRTVMRPEIDRIVTANAAIDGAVGMGRQAHPSADFDTGHRADRITAILDSRADWALEEMAQVQMDVRSLYALQLVALIGPGPWQGEAAEAWALLADWDGTMGGSGAAALFALVERALPAAIFDETNGHRVGRIDLRKRLLRIMRGQARLDWFDNAGTAAVETRSEVLSSVLASSWSSAVDRWGPAPDEWGYGTLHQLHLENPLGSVPLLGATFNRGPTPWPGSDTTVAAFGTFSGGNRERIAYGPSMRWISDPTDPDLALSVLPGGQSGHPYDEHYDDQLSMYRDGLLHGVHWSTAAATDAAVSTLHLLPTPRQSGDEH